MTLETAMKRRYYKYSRLERTDDIRARMCVIENIVNFAPEDKSGYIRLMLNTARKNTTTDYQRAYLEELELIAKDLNL